MKDGVLRQITAKAVVGGQEFSLPGSPVPVLIPNEPEPIGWFDFISPEYVFGWSCDPTSPQLQSSTISVYDESGSLVSTGQTTVDREQALLSLCGSQKRGFQLDIPASMQDYQRHTLFVFATNAQGSATKLIGIRSATLRPQLYSDYGIPRQVTPANIDDVVGAAVISELPPSDGLLRINTYCFGPGIDDTPVAWDPSSFTGFSVTPHQTTCKSCGNSLSPLQRGLVDKYRETVVQAEGLSFGIFVRTAATGHNPECGNLAGSGPGFSWFPNSPVPWPTEEQSIKGREIYVRFNASVNWSNGISYVHPSLFFRDQRNNKRVWWTIQAFDSRLDVQDEYLSSDGNPIVVTSFSRSGTRGRHVAGSFYRGGTMPYTHFDYRLNGYQFERMLELAGCGPSPEQLSCNPIDYQLTIGFIEAETASSDGELGTKISDVEVGITQFGAIY